MENKRWHCCTLLEGVKMISIILGLLFALCIRQSVAQENYHNAFLNRTSFPHGFIFGVASSAYQVVTHITQYFTEKASL